MTPYDQIKADWGGKKILIFGLGVQGRGVEDAIFFGQLGCQVTVTDKKTSLELKPSLDQLTSHDITYTLGEHKPSDILGSDLIIRNASVPLHHPLLDLARSKNIPVRMDEDLFFTYARPHAVGITGTRGKSTTTTLIYQLLKHLPRTVILAGNIVHHASLPLLKNHQPDNLYVFELSSWQLQGFHQQKISPQVAVITNVYPDHLLDRSFSEYVGDKTAIFAYQNPSDTLLINQIDPHLTEISALAKGKIIPFSVLDIPSTWQIKLPGRHNLENIAAAIKVARLFHVPDDQIKAVTESFSGLPFRLEKIANIKGVDIINDTTSTTPVATIKALETYPDSILILGGTSKNLPTDDLITAVNAKAKTVILLSGSGTDEIKPFLKPELIQGEYEDLKEAVNRAFSLALADVSHLILFSPGFTSFGMFQNEFDRGEQFNRLISDHRE